MRNTNPHLKFIDGKIIVIKIDMKSKVYLTTLCAIVLVNSCIQAQNAFFKDSVEKMIQNFYIEYCNVWNNTPISVPANVLHERIDSLAQKYCTKKVRNEAKAWFANGQELFTKDYGIVNESLKTLIITKDSTIENNYIIAYTTINSDASGKQIQQKVVLHVSVVKEKDSYKINWVK